MFSVGAKTRKVTTYGRKKTQIITIHSDFTPIKSKAESPVHNVSSDDEYPQPSTTRFPLTAKTTQDVLVQKSNISATPCREGKKGEALDKGKGKLIEENLIDQPVKPKRATRKAAVKSVKGCNLPTVASRRPRQTLDCVEIVATPAPAKGDQIGDLATQLFGLDINEAPSSSKATPVDTPADPLNELLASCDHTSIIPFSEFLDSHVLSAILPGRSRFEVKKIGEASYSEVFSLKRGKEIVVVKVVPLLPACEVETTEGDEVPDCSDPKDVLREVTITRTLSGLEKGGFVACKGVYIVEGVYPSALLDQWLVYKEEHGSSSACPDVLSATQKYALLVLEDGGLDLESFDLDRNIGWIQAAGVFWQIVNTLSIAEQETFFEHRDLHEGQILISACDHTDSTDLTQPPSSGVKATIIDFGLSRLNTDQSQVVWSQIPQEVYEGVGDQWDVYRSMRDEIKGDWEGYHSITNVMWLRYIARYLLSSKDMRKPTTKLGPRAPSSPLKARRVPLSRQRDSVVGDRVVEKNGSAYEMLKGMEKALSDSLRRKGSLVSAVNVLEYGKKRGWVL